MNKFTDGLQFGIPGNLFLQEIFNRLDIMIGSTFDVFNTLRVLFAEFINNIIEQAVSMGTERRDFPDSCMCCKCLQPPYFNNHPVTYQAILTEDRTQRICF